MLMINPTSWAGMGLPGHGFSRYRAGKGCTFVFTLQSNAATELKYPFHFQVRRKI